MYKKEFLIRSTIDNFFNLIWYRHKPLQITNFFKKYRQKLWAGWKLKLGGGVAPRYLKFMGAPTGEKTKVNEYGKQANSKLTKEIVRLLEDAFSIGADIPAACFKANITKQTFFNWMLDYPDLKEKFYRLKENPILKSYQTVFDNLHSPEHAKWYLERKRKEEFSTKTIYEEQHPQSETELDREEQELEKRERDLEKRLRGRKNPSRARKNKTPKEANPAPTPAPEGQATI